MELAVIYDLNPPAALEGDQPITYKCGECGETIMNYNLELHAQQVHHTSLFVRRNLFVETPLEHIEPTG